MRLTLRTLLAHLDNTLEADDNAAIAAKLRESEFASNLVKRITAAMESDQIGAPSPVSTSTADDPNRIGEYLDSVLSAEQVAEIERICLESDEHLAEVAACHQILTIVLGNPAEIPPTLRTQIYELGQNRAAGGSTMSANGNVGSVQRSASITGTPAGDNAITRALASHPLPGPHLGSRSNSVPPVGLDDSGVSDAPTRLRAAGAMTADEAALASSTPGTRRIRASEIPDFIGRPSRVIPWLVSLALVASFLFVAVQAFSPLLRKRTAAIDGEKIASSDPETDLQSEMTDPAIQSQADMVREGLLTKEIAEAPPIVEAEPGQLESDMSPPVPPESTTSNKPSTPAAEAITDAGPKTPSAAMAQDADQAPMVEDVMPSTNVPEIEPMDPSNAEADSKPSIASTSKLISDGSLFMLRKPTEANYVLAKKDELIPNGSDLICPPLYRDKLSIASAFEMTMIGPARLMIEQPDESTVVLIPSIGRLLFSRPLDAVPLPTDAELQSVAPEMKVDHVRLSFGGVEHELSLLEPISLAAIDVVHRRPHGTDPENPKSSSQTLEVLAVQGNLRWKTEGADEVTIATGEFLRWTPGNEPVKSPISKIPSWIEPKSEAAGSIESSAREGLLTLVRGNESIELSLREAIDFRRAEVGALAAQTLILLDRPAVYFGADGILSDVKQKAFWENHFVALVAAVDRSPNSAAIVREAIEQMDEAEAAAIYRLLWLFSNEQLDAGSDELLVTSLDSANMRVRVLATENLRQITGTTLFFKPENETAPRRSSDIKKWETRVRKRDIRWPEAVTPIKEKP